MVTSLAAILERKRQEELKSKQNMLQTVSAGQMEGQKTADKIVANKREAESKEFNLGNAAIAGATGLITSGGNPFAAGLAAIGSARGKKIKPLESVVSGGVQGLTTGKLSVADLGKKENLPKLVPILKQVGASKKVVNAVETYSKAEEVKSAAEKKDKTAKDVAYKKEKTSKETAKNKFILEALKEYGKQLNELYGEEKKAFIANKEKFIDDFVSRMEGGSSDNKDPLGLL